MKKTFDHIMREETKKLSPQVITGKIYKAYFQSLYEEGDPDRQTGCIIIANNFEEALEKVRAAFPEQTINMLTSDDDRCYGGNLPPRNKIVL